MGQKIIFLDFDGVLNSSLSKEIKIHNKEKESILEHYIDQTNLDILKLATEKTGAQLVISSTWRKDHYFIGDKKDLVSIIDCFKNLFAKHGWLNAPIINITPTLSGFRGEEVAVFLDNYFEKIDDYLILDDGSDFFYDINQIQPHHYRKFEFDIYPLGTRPHWENQKLIQVNPLTGLSYDNLIDILKLWAPQDPMVLEYQDYEPYLPNYTKKFKIN